jgi:alpha-beta hydrolase superfamily lysophospholipase
MMSKIVPTLALPSGLQGRDVTRDAELAGVYDRDPLNNKKATARWFTEAMQAIERVHARAGEVPSPLLLLYGGADKVASADATDKFAAKLKGAVEKERLADHYHELVNEPPAVRDKVIDRIGTWLLARANA